MFDADSVCVCVCVCVGVCVCVSISSIHMHSHTTLSNCGSVVISGAGESTGREQGSGRYSGSAGDIDEETAIGAPERHTPPSSSTIIDR